MGQDIFDIMYNLSKRNYNETRMKMICYDDRTTIPLHDVLRLRLLEWIEAKTTYT